MTPEIKQRIQQIRQGKTPKGYKKTKEGLICEDWNVELLERLSNIYSGQNTIRISDGEYPVYGSTGIISSSDSYKYDMEQILVARVGAHAGYVQIASGKYDVSDNTLIVSLNKKCSLKYLYYHLINNNLNNFATGSGQPLITASQLKKMKIPLPPLPEQTAIAEILSTQDRVIELKEQLLAEKKRQKKYLMQQLLTGKMRLKGFKGEWKRCKLGDVVIIERGGSPRPIEAYITNDSNGLNWIKIGDAPIDGNYITKTSEKIRPEGLSKTRQVHPGDLILSNSMSFGRPYIMNISGCIHDGWLLIRDDNNIFNKLYLCYLLSSDLMLNQYKSFAAGSTVNNLNKDLVGRTIIEFPPLPEQTAIAEILSTADREIELLGQSIEAEKRKKKSLMQLLLTGIVRVGGVL